MPIDNIYQVTKINYKSDFSVEMGFVTAGQPVGIPGGDFALVFRTDPHGAVYACSRIGGVYTNCKVVDDTLVCIFDNHNLKPGVLTCEAHDLVPDSLFPTGKKSIVTPSMLDIELVDGAGDGDAVSAEIVIDLDTLITEAEQAITDANNAADAADGAARSANDAATAAIAAIAALGDCKVVKYGKMINGEMYPYALHNGIPVISSQPFAHNTSFYYVDVTEKKAYQWGDGAFAIVTGSGGGTTYTAGDGISINSSNVISADVVAVPTEDSTKLMNAGGIYNALLGKADLNILATVAFSGSYSDLLNKPTIPAAQVQADWVEADEDAVDYIKNKPAIPTKTSDLNNDSGFVAIPYVNLDGRKTKSNSFDTLTGNGNGITLTEGRLLLIRMSAVQGTAGNTLYINLDQANNYPATSSKEIVCLTASGGQVNVKTGDYPQNTQLFLRWYNNSIWVVVGSGTLPVNLNGYATTSSVNTQFNNYDPIIEDTRSSQVAAITGTAPFATLVDGQRIILHLAYGVTNGTTLSLTLSDGITTTTAKPIKASYKSEGNGEVGINVFPRAGSYLHLVWDATYNGNAGCWHTLSDIDTDTLISPVSTTDVSNETTYSRAITGKFIHDNLIRTIDTVATTSGVASVTLDANKYIAIGDDTDTCSAVTLYLPAGASRTDEFLCTFVCADASTTLTLPANVEMGGGLTFEAAADRVVQVSIMDGIALYTYLDPTNNE